MADKRISQLIERVDIANNDVLPIVASGATTTNKVTVSTLQDWMQDNLDVGVTSVGLSMPSAFVVSNSPVTGSGNISVTGAGSVSQYIRGDGSLADFPSGGGGGGSSVNYYLNGSVSQGTIGGIAYQEMNKVPVLGAGTDFTIAADGYIASFITDAGDPALLQIPAGNWNFETYLQASSGGGTPSFYIELYKVDSGGTATLIASNSGSPELIAFGTVITPYFSALAVPETILTLTDRLALRYYVNHSGRTITLHTENNTLCQIITTFTTGVTALNGLTAQVQNFATGTSGTDFAITSSVSTHTFNLPDASTSARGVVSTGNQTFAGIKTFNSTIVAGQEVQIVQVGTALPIFIKNISGTFLTAIGSNGIGFNGSNNIYFAGSNKLGGVIAWNNTDNRTYTLQDASGTLAFTSDISNSLTGYVTLDTTQTITGAKTFDSLTSTFVAFNTSNPSGGALTFRRNGANLGHIGNSGVLGVGILDDLEVRSGISRALHLKTDGGKLTLSSAGAVSLDGALNGTTANFIVNQNSTTTNSFQNTNTTDTNSRNILDVTAGNSTLRFLTINNDHVYISPTTSRNTYLGFGNALTLASTGAATFSSSVSTANEYYVSGAGQNAFKINSAGSFYGMIQNTAADKWSLAYGVNGAGNTALGTSVLTWTGSGNVGIGTASPANILSIRQSNTSTATVLELTNTSTGSNTTKASRLLFGLADTVGTVKDAAFIQSTPSSGLPNVQDAELIFGTRNSDAGPTEAMRITSGRNVLIGQQTSSLSTNGWLLQGVGGGHTSFEITNNEAFIFNNRTTGATYQIDFRTNSVERGSISVTDSSTSYNTSSDYRLKENVKPVENALSVLTQLKPCTFNFIVNAEEEVMGFLAHEVQEVMPQAIKGEKDAVRIEQVEVSPAQLDEEGNVITEAVIEEQEVPVYQGIDHSKLVPLLVAAIQELKTEIDLLKNQMQ